MTLPPRGAFHAPYRYVGLSDVGRSRPENQDRWAADPEQGLFVVADGMGGGLCGGLASQIVVDTLPVLLRKRRPVADDQPEAQPVAGVAGAIAELSEMLLRESRGKPGLEGMGSTVVLALVRDNQALVGHLGDSRAYLLREGTLTRLTNDHSIVQILIDTGALDPREAAQHPARGQLTRFVGMAGECLPEVVAVPLQSADRLLLCTDGLTSLLSDAALAAILIQNDEPLAACKQLIHAANAAGGPDNITAVVVSMKNVA